MVQKKKQEVEDPPPTAVNAWWAQHRRRLQHQAEGLDDRPSSEKTPLGRALAPNGSAQALADYMGRPKATISRWRCGHSQPALEDVPRIAHAMRVLFERGIVTEAPTVIEILYPFGFPKGCTDIAYGEPDEELARALRILGATFDQRAAGGEPWLATAATELRSVLAGFGLTLWERPTREASLPEAPPAE